MPTENVKARQRALDLANRLLADNRKQVRHRHSGANRGSAGAESGGGSTQAPIVSQSNLQLQQLLTKNAISRNLTDPQLMDAEVIPTDAMQAPAVEPVIPTQDLIADALSHRPELAQAEIDLTNRDINKKAARNALLPALDFVTWYGTNALAGRQNSALPVCTGTATQFCARGTAPTTGFGHAFTTLFGNDFPDYAVGFNLNIPLRNRAAQATQVRSELEYRQAQMRLQQLQNQIRIEVRNAQYGLLQNRARVDAASQGRQLAIESLNAEQKKYALGASTSYNVLQMQRDLATAESNLITAMAAYSSRGWRWIALPG